MNRRVGALRGLLVLLVGLGMVLGPLGLVPTEAASPPKLTFKTEKVKLKLKCGKVTVKIKKPVLKGSTKSNRSKVAKWADWLEKELLKDAKSDRYFCEEVMPAFGTTASGDLYQGRYVSVMMAWEGGFQAGNLKTLNLDLKTGKTVKLSEFASNKGRVFDFAQCLAFDEKHGEYEYWYAHLCSAESPRPPVGWRVTKKGIRTYVLWEGWNVSALVPWKHIVKPSYKKQKKHVTKNVPTLSPHSDELVSSDTRVTVQGNLVTVVAAGRSYYGAKGMATTGKPSWLRVVVPGKRDRAR